MEWEKPEVEGITLACEISGYANAELAAEAKAETLPGAETQSFGPGCSRAETLSA